MSTDTQECAKTLQFPRIASPTVDQLFSEFLAEQKVRLKPKTFSKYDEVIDLLRSNLNSYAHDGLSKSEKQLFDRNYDAKGDAHRSFCQIFGAEKIFEGIGSFFSYFMIRKVMASAELKTTSCTVVKKLSAWLLQKGYISSETAASACEEGEEASTVLPIADRATEILAKHVDGSAIEPSDLSDEDYIEFDHFTITKLEPGKFWFGYYDPEGEGKKTLGPVAVPSAATKLLKEGWDISCGFGRIRDKWHLIEMGNIYPS